jgi:chromosome segregation ATPase
MENLNREHAVALEQLRTVDEARLAALARADKAEADLDSHVKALDARLAEVKRERDELALALHRAEEQRDAARHNLEQARADLSAETAALAQVTAERDRAVAALAQAGR